MALDLAKSSWIGHQKAQEAEEKIDKLDFVKIKNFGTLKDNIKKVKRQGY